MPLYLIAVILGIVEGLTEFLPISSTGHLIVADRLLGFPQMMANPDKVELFEVVIQLGSILAIGVIYRKRLMESLMAKSTGSTNGCLRTNLLLAFLPAAIIGLATHHIIKTYLFSPLVVAITLILGGIAIIIIEKSLIHSQRLCMREEERTITMDTMRPSDALVVGFAQVLSLIPGTSRSASTIMGGMLRGIKRADATEFSFLLAFPIMVAASAYEMFKYRHLLHADMLGLLAVGFIVSFIVALAVVAWFIQYIKNHKFTGFGYYRIIFGAIVLALFLSNYLR